MAEAEQVCDRVLIIDRGKIVGDTVLNRPGQMDRVIVLRLHQFHSGVTDRLMTIEGVLNVDPVDSHQTVYRLHCAANSEPEGEVVRVAVESGWEPVELSASHTELESLFLQSVGREES